ncbi:NAD(+)--protein-arginine ADP-ribosyltransferase Tre1 [Serratia quinivorans]|uniref:NAD(+)--protein-arginine ADP-ribosyltransferase Tre1 n=1 Tax=Serratia quinivorans TaxID=137545 RepID=UPI00217B2CE5|nr:NAD(+)--protein-arginine ADP-ribosyltransferase Tre1 [Serratia quinivorans]CAI0702184.1 Mono(ADP-ribosyl)transferase SpvB [Serratia quinivorans]
MSELSAARELDEIAHTASEGWMIAGLIGGAIVGAALIAVTGGTAAVAVAAVVAGASAGGGLGEVLGSMSWAPRHVTGVLADGSPNVYINGRPAIRAHISTGECSEDGPAKKVVAQGSAKVYINDFPAARINDLLACSAEIHTGSPNVIIGGEKEQTDDIEPEIPDWVNWTLLAAGAGAAAVLATPAIAILGTLGGLGGGFAGSLIGGAFFGEGSDGQKWSMLAGGFVGGFAGGEGGAKFDAWRNTKIVEPPPRVTTKVDPISPPRMTLAEAVGQEQAKVWTQTARANAEKNNAQLSTLLTDDQIGAIYGYTTNEGYTALNPALRGQTPLTPELEAFTGHVTDGLNKLPAYNGETYRGTTLPAHILEQNQIGGTVSDGGFMSTSAKTPFDGDVSISVRGNSGKQIDFLSKYKNEAEVLYPPNTRFEVINRIEQNGTTHLLYREIP